MKENQLPYNTGQLTYDLGQLALASIEARTLAPTGEFLVEVKSLKLKQASTGRLQIEAVCEIKDGKYNAIFQRYNLPMPSDPETSVVLFAEQLATFCDGFNIPRESFLVSNFPSFIGSTGYWFVGIKPGKDGYEDSSKLTRPARR